MIRWFLILFVCFSSCNNSFSYSEDERAADRVMSKALLKLRQEKNLIPCGTGGRMMNEIKMLALAFDYYKPLNIEEARELLVYAVDKFVSEINSDEKIRPYLVKYPFDSKNVQIRIFIRNSDGSDVKTGELYIITALEGEFKYKIHGSPYLKTIHTEIYETAIAEMFKPSQKSA